MAEKETRVQKLDRHVEPYRRRGDSVLVATVKAARDIRRETKNDKK